MKRYLPHIVVTAIAVAALAIGADNIGPSEPATVIVVFAIVALVVLAIVAALVESEEEELKARAEEVEDLRRALRRAGPLPEGPDLNTPDTYRRRPRINPGDLQFEPEFMP